MPTSKEVVANRPLSGSELRTILTKDFDAMLAGDGMFTPHMGYRRVAYEISIKLHVENPLFPEHTNKRASRDPARNADETMKKIEAPPLKNPDDTASVVGLKRARKVDSPNVARLENNMPVIVTATDRQTGQMVEKPVHYDKAGIEPSPVEDTDISAQAAHEWNQ